VTLEAAVGDEFRTTVQPTARTATTARYSALVPVTIPLVARDTSVAKPRIGTLQTGTPDTAARNAVLELVVGSDTARAPLRLNLAVVPRDVPRTGVVTAPANAPSDWTTRGRNDTSGPFHYFWPAGVQLVITGEKDGFYRARLTNDRHVWVPTGDVRLYPAGAPPASAAIGSVRFSPQPQWIDLRIPVPERVPFEVTQMDDVMHIDVFHATSRVNFFQYGGLDPLIERAEWSQPADGVFRVTVDLTEPVWGYHPFYDAGGALVLRIRRPPAIDVTAPLSGLLIAVDPGHGGDDRATRGPTGFTEADANLGIALQLQQQLEAAGARVLMTRTRDMTVPLGDRPRIAADSGAHILVSVHNNAFPDGVNPWLNAGTSVYYFQPHSADLARLLHRELLEELGLRDIGYGRADLALVRPTWMPAVLSETMFMMIPQQEAGLHDPEVQARIARAHVQALEAFLVRRARH
jgi:N-acetylmuramoyl-L-alanine amidase